MSYTASQMLNQVIQHVLSQSYAWAAEQQLPVHSVVQHCMKQPGSAAAIVTNLLKHQSVACADAAGHRFQCPKNGHH